MWAPTTATIGALHDGVPFAPLDDAAWGVACEAGVATSTGFVVPDRRVLLPMKTSALHELTDDGWQLLENAVNWVDAAEIEAASPRGTVALLADDVGAHTAITHRRLRRLGFDISIHSTADLADLDLTSLDGIVLGASVDPSVVDVESFAGGVLSFRPRTPGNAQTAQIFTGVPNYIVRENSRQLGSDPIRVDFEPREHISGEAVIVAHIAPEEVVIHAYNIGAQLGGPETAAGRRITFRLPVENIDRDSMELFDRAALWAFDLGR